MDYQYIELKNDSNWQDGNQFTMECHPPDVMCSDHYHGHIEVNYLEGCSAEYQLNGKPVHVPEARFTLF